MNGQSLQLFRQSKVVRDGWTGCLGVGGQPGSPVPYRDGLPDCLHPSPGQTAYTLVGLPGRPAQALFSDLPPSTSPKLKIYPPRCRTAEGAGSCKPVLARFVILRDSREQEPWLFNGMRAGTAGGYAPMQVEVRLGSLDIADYTILGAEESIRVERKSAADLVGTLKRRREQFETELQALGRIGFSAVIVESDFESLIRNSPSRMSSRSLAGSIVALSMRYTPRWYFAGSRTFAEALCFPLFERWHKDNMPAARAKRTRSARSRGAVRLEE